MRLPEHEGALRAPLRVALVTITCRSDGGQDQYTLELARHLASRGHRVDVITSAFSAEVPAGVRFVRAPALGGPSLTRFPSFYASASWVVQQRRREYDIVHGAGGNMNGADVITAHYSHRAEAREVRAEAAEPSTTFARRWARRLSHRVSVVLEDREYRRHPYVIGVSERTRRDIVEHHGLPASRTCAVHNGVDVERFHPRNRIEGRALRLRLSIGPEQLAVSFVGAFERKGLATVIDALARHRELGIHLIVAGEGDRSRFLERAQQAGIGERVHFLGHQPDVAPVYAASDLCVFPTLYEPFGLVPLEAMSSGVPAIVSECAGVSELIDREREHMVIEDPRDSDALAAMLFSVFSQRALRERLSESARRIAEQNTWAKVAERTEAAYRAALE